MMANTASRKDTDESVLLSSHLRFVSMQVHDALFMQARRAWFDDEAVESQEYW
jgi:hypothetical protein